MKDKKIIVDKYNELKQVDEDKAIEFKTTAWRLETEQEIIDLIESFNI